jgi:hypothetical protein
MQVDTGFYTGMKLGLSPWVGEKRRWGVFENELLRKMCGREKDEVTGRCGKLRVGTM